jgi:hypothetical protein
MSTVFKSVDILSTDVYICVCFRAMGHYIRFINNRDLATENIMRSAVRVQLVLSSPPGCISSLIKRLRSIPITLPKRSSITLADELKTIRGNLPGEYALQLRPSRRNTKPYTISETSPLLALVGALMRSLHHPHTYLPDQSASHSAMIAGTVVCNSSFLIYIMHVTSTLYIFRTSTPAYVDETNNLSTCCLMCRHLAQWTSIQPGRPLRIHAFRCTAVQPTRCRRTPGQLKVPQDRDDPHALHLSNDRVRFTPTKMSRFGYYRPSCPVSRQRHVRCQLRPQRNAKTRVQIRTDKQHHSRPHRLRHPQSETSASL